MNEEMQPLTLPPPPFAGRFLRAAWEHTVRNGVRFRSVELAHEHLRRLESDFFMEEVRRLQRTLHPPVILPLAATVETGEGINDE